MFFKIVKLLLLLLASVVASEDLEFKFDGFNHSSLVSLDGIAAISNGLLQLTNYTVQKFGHALYFNPVQFKNPSDGNASSFSFSTTFVFAIVPKPGQSLSGQGIAFFIAPTRELPGALPSQFLGLFNATNNGDPANHLFAVELDPIRNTEYEDMNDNHVGIDINGLRSIKSAPAMYATDNNGGYRNLSLKSGNPMQVWVEYDGAKKQVNVTIADFKVPQPSVPLLSLPLDLSPILLDYMYVGFSAAAGSTLTSHYILGWSFKSNGKAPSLNLSKLPKLPKRKDNNLKILMPMVATAFVITIICSILFVVIRKKKFEELGMEDWEANYRSHRFSYKDLYIATKGFKKEEVIGNGGFGKVYKGVLPTSKIEVAVKRISHDSKQGMKEFIAEIITVGQFRHKNIVQLLGYCRRRRELLLVYELMQNGSLDIFLFDSSNDLYPLRILDWEQRFRTIKDVAYGLLYLHQECEQVAIHRDIKSSNVLLDADMNAKISDFGLAKLYDRGTNPGTTIVAGTVGYLAPEVSRTGKATTSSDVFAFGAFLLEVACGRRPVELSSADSEAYFVLFDWVFSSWRKGAILEVSDPKLGTEYAIEEMELVLKLGLLCSHILSAARPSMKQVVQYLEGDALLPASELWSLSVTVGLSTNQPRPNGGSLEDISLSYSSAV